jgi:hypothetical protein
MIGKTGRSLELQSFPIGGTSIMNINGAVDKAFEGG